MPSLMEEIGGVVSDTLPAMFAEAKVRCTWHPDEQAIGMAWKHDGEEFYCTGCFVYENTACTKSTKALYEWTRNFAGVISRMRKAVGLPELSPAELREIVSRPYTRVIRAQDGLLRMGCGKPGAYYTGKEFYDCRLRGLYSMQSQLEAISASLSELPVQEVPGQ